MKNIQVIDGALNCTYSLFAATEKEFAHLFPGQTDVAFADELFERLGEQTAARLLNALRERPVDKKTAAGIHGTLFYQLPEKKPLYPTRQERGMDPRAYSPAQRQLLGLNVTGKSDD